MNKVLKYSLIAVAGVVLLAVVGAMIVAATFDPNQYKADIERIAREQTGRTLKLAGNLELAFYPSIGAKVAGVSFSERSSEKEFLSLESAQVSVKLMPLLRGEVIVDALRVAGLKANVVKGKDGKFNFADLLEGGGEKNPKARRPPEKKGGGDAVKFDIAGVNVERSAVSYRDLGKGSEIALSDLRLATGRIAEAAQGKLDLGAVAKGRNPDLDFKVDLRADYSFDLAAKAFSLSKLDAKLSGAAAGLKGLQLSAQGDVSADPAKNEYRVSGLNVEFRAIQNKEALEGKLSAPNLLIAADTAKGEAVNAEFKLKGEARAVEVKMKLSGVQGSAKALVVPRFTADLAVASPDLPMKSVKIPVTGSLRADLEKQTASVELATKFDESTIKARLGLAKFAPPNYVFDVNIDRLDLDKYLPPDSKPVAGAGKPSSAPPKADAPIDLSPLKGLNARGKLQIGFLQARGLKLSKVRAEVRTANGRLDVAPHSASLYDGTLSGALSVQAEGNRIALKETLSSVSVGPLLRDVAKQDRLDGRGSVALDVTAAGKTVDAMKRALGGTAKVNLKDGAIKGFDIAGMLKKAKSALGGGQSAQAANATQKTSFSELSASFTIKNGVAHNEDLSAKAPLFRLGGRGDIDIGNSTLDYVAKASVVASSKGQGGDDLAALAGITVPVHLTGTFEDMKYQVDYGAIAAGLAKSKIVDTIKGGASNLGERLKGLFGR